MHPPKLSLEQRDSLIDLMDLFRDQFGKGFTKSGDAIKSMTVRFEEKWKLGLDTQAISMQCRNIVERHSVEPCGKGTIKEWKRRGKSYLREPGYVRQKSSNRRKQSKTERQKTLNHTSTQPLDIRSSKNSEGGCRKSNRFTDQKEKQERVSMNAPESTTLNDDVPNITGVPYPVSSPADTIQIDASKPDAEIQETTLSTISKPTYSVVKDIQSRSGLESTNITEVSGPADLPTDVLDVDVDKTEAEIRETLLGTILKSPFTGVENIQSRIVELNMFIQSTAMDFIAWGPRFSAKCRGKAEITDIQLPYICNEVLQSTFASLTTVRFVMGAFIWRRVLDQDVAGPPWHPDQLREMLAAEGRCCLFQSGAPINPAARF